MKFLVVLLSILAVWRVTHMLQNEHGPFGIFARLQAWVASRPDTVGGIQQGFFCFYCLSIWVSVPFAFALSDNPLSLIVYILALSGGAILVNSVIEKLEQ